MMMGAKCALTLSCHSLAMRAEGINLALRPAPSYQRPVLISFPSRLTTLRATSLSRYKNTLEGAQRHRSVTSCELLEPPVSLGLQKPR